MPTSWKVTEMSNQSFDYTGFTCLKLEKAIHVDILKSDDYSLTVGDSLNRIKVEKAGDTLIIGRRGFDWITPFQPRPHVVITMPDLAELSLSGACQAKAVGFMSDHELAISLSGASHAEIDKVIAGSLKINVSDASNLNGNANAIDDFTLELTGASRINLAGSGKTGNIKISGASQARLANMVLNSASINLSGASNAQLKVNANLEIVLSGASRLEYSGSPVFGKVSVSGASTLKQR
jgi:uncharacterized protein YaiE (UPF0345 family)